MKGIIFGRKVEHTKDIGWTTRCTDRAYLYGKMAVFMKGSMRMTKNKAWGNFFGRMDEVLLEVGKMASSTVEDIANLNKVKGDMDSGAKEPEGSGLMSQIIIDIAVK